MGNFFRDLGKSLRGRAQRLHWLFMDLTGTEEERIRAEFKVGETLARYFLPDEEELPARRELLFEVGARLAQCSKQCRKREFRFAALKGRDRNAFALPGGFIFVTSGLIDFAESDREELAFVLAHEMAHVVLWHAADAYKTRVLLDGIPSTPAPSGMARILGDVAKRFLENQYSQELEFEADERAVGLMKRAECDATAAIRLLERLPGGSSPLGVYFSSHPPRELRVERIRRLLE